jgi:energy-coupling factor transporter transmembrane protein EcfT
MSILASSINNPLALIAVLAATTEASALASLPLLDYRNQAVFVWFLVLFPPFLTALFFITLNFNRQALMGDVATGAPPSPNQCTTQPSQQQAIDLARAQP